MSFLQHHLTFDDQTIEPFICLVDRLKPDVVLEFGMGGSTHYFIGNQVSTLISIETDPIWAWRTDAQLETLVGGTAWIPMFVNIGKTGKWGRPVDDTKRHLFIDYWQKPLNFCNDFNLKPNLILIDGRFRIATALASFAYLEGNFVILIDDYHGRPNYHVVEDYFGQPEELGRMACFNIGRASEAERLAALQQALRYWQDVE